MRRLLITGASGLLGANLVLRTQSKFKVTAVVHSHEMVFEEAQVVKADLSDASTARQVFEDLRPEWTIHCAADTAIDALELNPDRAARLNMHMADIAASMASSIGSKFLFISTDSVFDGRAGPYREQDNPSPLNAYARSKLDGERVVMERDPQALIVRTNFFGWSPNQNRSLAEWFYSKLERGEGCTGFSDILFSPVYAPELAAILISLLEREHHGLFHIPGDECLSKLDFGRRIAKVFGYTPDLIQSGISEQAHPATNRPKRTCLDGSKLQRTLGISLPKLNEGVNQFRADLELGIRDSLRLRSKAEANDA